MYKVMIKDFDKASSVLGNAFYDDPIWKGLYPDDNLRKHFLPAMFRFLLFTLSGSGYIYAPSENIEGAAIWMRSEKSNIGFSRVLFGGHLKEKIKFMKKYKKEMGPLMNEMKVIEKDRNRLMKGRKYLYLSAIGVAPEHQHKGHGSGMLKFLFKQAAEENLPVYLETETEENVSIYEHYGFKTIDERDFQHRGFHIWQMVRE